MFLAEPLMDFQAVDVELEFAGACGIRFDFGDGMVGAVLAFVLVRVDFAFETHLLTVEHSSYHIRSEAYLLAEFFEYQQLFDVRKEVENLLQVDL